MSQEKILSFVSFSRKLSNFKLSGINLNADFTSVFSSFCMLLVITYQFFVDLVGNAV